MSVLSRPHRASRADTGSGTAPTAAAPAGIPAPRPARHDQGVPVGDRLGRPGQERPGDPRRRVLLALAAALLTAAAVGTGVVVTGDGDTPSVLAPSHVHTPAEVDALRDQAVRSRFLTRDGQRAGEAQREAAMVARATG